MSADEYIKEVESRLRADGAEVTTESIRDLTTLVGYRSQFRLRWMGVRLNLFTIVGTVPLVTFGLSCHNCGSGGVLLSPGVVRGVWGLWHGWLVGSGLLQQPILEPPVRATTLLNRV